MTSGTIQPLPTPSHPCVHRLPPLLCHFEAKPYCPIRKYFSVYL